MSSLEDLARKAYDAARRDGMLRVGNPVEHIINAVKLAYQLGKTDEIMKRRQEAG